MEYRSWKGIIMTPERHPTRRRLRLTALTGLSLLLVGTPAMVLISLQTKADWAYVGVLATFCVGVFMIGAAVVPTRSSFRAGTKVWQNDGLPGGGGG